jgi:hypothetical protein
VVASSKQAGERGYQRAPTDRIRRCRWQQEVTI